MGGWSCEWDDVDGADPYGCRFLLSPHVPGTPETGKKFFAGGWALAVIPPLSQFGPTIVACVFPSCDGHALPVLAAWDGQDGCIECGCLIVCACEPCTFTHTLYVSECPCDWACAVSRQNRHSQCVYSPLMLGH